MRRSLLILVLLHVAISACDKTGGPSATALTTKAITISGTGDIRGRGKTLQLKAIATLSDGSTQDQTGTATWTSTNVAVATINSAGLVTSIALGTTTISATVGGIAGSVTVNVIPLVVAFEAISAGALVGGNNAGVAFKRDGVTFFTASGGGPGRGFNIAVVNRTTGDLIGPVMTFDTWLDPLRTNMVALASFLDGIAPGNLALIAVSDDAGLDEWDSCRIYSDPTTQAAVSALERLGSTLIRQYCYRGSWSMIAVKATGKIDEHLAPTSPVTSVYQLQVD